MKKNKRVLIVEDDTWLSDNYVRYFDKQGFKTQVVNNAQLAINAIDDFKPKIVILDFLLPDGNALPLLHEINSYTDISSTIIILCSNLAKDLSIDDLSAYGVKKIIDKTTMQPNDLVNAVNGLIE
ncbi:MAG: response regulator [Candidatus Saccharimonadales bacterium]|jgi:DNA-binding response OmpR family regulator